MKYFVPLLIAALVFVPTALGGEIRQTDTELVSELPVGTDAKGGQVLYSIGPIKELKKGTVVDVRFQAEFTNDCVSKSPTLQANVGVSRRVIRAHAPDALRGKMVVKTAATNFDPERHHEVIVGGSFDYIEEDLTDVYYNLVVVAFSSEARCGGQGQSIKVEGYENDSYGELILEIRPD